VEHAQVLFLATLLALGFFVVPPIVTLVVTSFQQERRGEVVGLTLDNYANLVQGSSGTSEVLLNTVIYGLGSATFGLLFGGALAWIVERTNTPFKGLVYMAAFVSFATSGIVKVVGWILLLGPRAGILNTTLRDLFGLADNPFNIFSMGGMILLDGLLWTPVVFLLLAATFRTMDPHLEEAAATSGANQWRTLYHVTLRLALPTILSVLILTVVRSVEGFEIPALIGIPARIELLTTIVYQKIRTGMTPRYGEASAYAVLLMLLVMALLYPYVRLTRKASAFATISGKGYRPRRINLGRWRYLTAAIALALPVLVLLPLLVLLWASFLPVYERPSTEAFQVLTLANYRKALDDPKVVNAFVNTLTIGVASATIVMGLALFMAWVLFRTRVSARWLLEHLGSVPLVFPGVVLGIAVLRTYLVLPIPIYGTIWIIAVAYVARYIPYGLRFAEAGLLQINRELEESAQIGGAPFSVVLTRVVMPLMMPALVGGWIYVFLLSVKELSVAILLYGPTSNVVSATMFDLWQNGQVTELAAFCMVMTAVFVAIGLFFHRFSQRYGIQ
jgi:iron(III) transport system permease protein